MNKKTGTGVSTGIIAVAMAFWSLPLSAQELPEFGAPTINAMGGSLYETRAERERALKRQQEEEQSATKDSGETGELSEIITTGQAVVETPVVWRLKPAIIGSSDVRAYGMGAAARYGKSDLLLQYANIDPDGEPGPFHQYQARLTRLLYVRGRAELSGYVQFTRRQDAFREPSVLAGLTIRLPKSIKANFNAGWMWRDPDVGKAVDDFDGRFGVSREWPRFSVGADYRLKNDITGENDFSVGISARGVSFALSKHWTGVLSYTLEL